LSLRPASDNKQFMRRVIVNRFTTPVSQDNTYEAHFMLYPFCAYQFLQHLNQSCIYT